MNVAEADAVVRAAFAPWPSVKLTNDLREAWYETALRDTDYELGLRLARALAATCDYAPIPKQFIAMRVAARQPERKSELHDPGGDANTARIWARHIAVTARAIGSDEKTDTEGHERIRGGASDSWKECSACCALAREIGVAA